MISFVLILEETLIIVSADHSHVFTMAGYPQRGNPIFGLAIERGETEPAKAKDGLPYTVLGYANGPGGKRINGTRQNLTGVDTADKDYLQQATVWRGSETHAGDDVGARCNKVKQFGGGTKICLFIDFIIIIIIIIIITVVKMFCDILKRSRRRTAPRGVVT